MSPIATIDKSLFIDFEGEATGLPVLLGVFGTHDALGDRGSFRQFVFDPVLQRACTSPTEHGPCVPETLAGALSRIRQASEASGVQIYAWSSYEQAVIDSAVEGSTEAEYWHGRVTDAKAPAKRWKRTHHPQVDFPLTRGAGRHALRHYLALIEYRMPPTQQGGKTGARIRAVRSALERKESFEALTGVEKRKWRSLLQHNWHDCNGMRELMVRVSADG